MSATAPAGRGRPGGGPGPFGRGPFGGPGLPAEKPLAFWKSLRRLAGRLVPYRARIALVVSLAVVGVALSVAGPALLGRATDIVFSGFMGAQLPAGASLEDVVADLRAQGNDELAGVLEGTEAVPGQGVDFTALRDVITLALVLYLVSSLLLWLQGYLLNEVVQRVILGLRDEAEAKVHRLPLGYVDRQARGDLLSRVTNDVDNVSQTLQQTLGQLLTSLLTVVGMLTMMVVLSPLLALIAVVTVPLSGMLAAQIGKRSQRLFVRQWAGTGALNAHVEESFTGHDVVKVFGRRADSVAQFDERNERLYEASFGAQFVSGLIMPTVMFVGNLTYVAVAVVGGLRVATGGMTLGRVQAVIQYSRSFSQPLTQVASLANLMQSGVASAERVFDLLDAPEESAEPSVAQVPPALGAAGGSAAPARVGGGARVWGPGRVEFADVSFRYDPDRPLIRDLSLVAEPGHTVAIVGPTGAGKTTLVNLLMRFYEVDAGRITLDGVDVATMSRHELRSRIGMVLQDTWLFHGTIRDNIAYGRPGATDEQVREAARAALVDRFVLGLPDGYDTVIDEDGGNVSAGERQLITIARAFIADPALLILDEATSSVDTRTELLVQQAMAALREDRTSFVIAHRLSTIRDADLILVMEDGAIVERGTHESLLAAAGSYQRLYEAQFAGSAA